MTQRHKDKKHLPNSLFTHNWIQRFSTWHLVEILDAQLMEWSECSAIERVSGRVSGQWVFRNTRVPVQALFENLDSGATVGEFLNWVEGVTREQVDTALQFTSRSLAVNQ